MPRADRAWRVPAVAAAALVAVLANRGAWNVFFIYDDWQFVLSGEDVVLRGLEGLHHHWTTLFNHHEYRPVPYLLSALDYSLWGTNAAGWHATNLAIHAAATVALLELLRAATGSLRFATAAALLFAAMPLTADSASVISFREDSLATVFVLLSLRAATATLRAGRLVDPASVLAVALMGLAIGTKETALVGPALWLVLAWGARPRGYDPGRAVGIAAQLTIPALVYAAIRAWLPDSERMIDPELLGSPEARRAMAAIFAGYLADLVRYLWDFGLDADGAARPATATRVIVLLATLVALPVAGVVLAIRERSRMPAAALAWAFVATTPVLGFVMYGYDDLLQSQEYESWIAAYRLYLAAAGAAALLASPVLMAHRRPTIAMACVAVLVGYFTIESGRARTATWVKMSRGPMACWDAGGVHAPGMGPGAVILFSSGASFDCQMAFVQRLREEGVPIGTWLIEQPDGRLRDREFDYQYWPVAEEPLDPDEAPIEEDVPAYFIEITVGPGGREVEASPIPVDADGEGAAEFLSAVGEVESG